MLIGRAETGNFIYYYLGNVAVVRYLGSLSYHSC